MIIENRDHPRHIWPYVVSAAAITFVVQTLMHKVSSSVELFFFGVPQQLWSEESCWNQCQALAVLPEDMSKRNLLCDEACLFQSIRMANVRLFKKCLEPCQSLSVLPQDAGNFYEICRIACLRNPQLSLDWGEAAKSPEPEDTLGWREAAKSPEPEDALVRLYKKFSD